MSKNNKNILIFIILISLYEIVLFCLHHLDDIKKLIEKMKNDKLNKIWKETAEIEGNNVILLE